MSTPGVPFGRELAAACLLLSVAGLLAAPGAAGRPSHDLRLRLESVPGSPVSELSRPLAGDLRDRTRTGRRTPRFGTDGHALVAVTWRGAPTPEVRVRSRADGSWTGWLPAPPLTDLPDGGGTEGTDVRGTQPLWVGASDGVQVSLRGKAPADLALVLIDPGARETEGDGLGSARTTWTATSTGEVPRPALRTRAGWGADERWRNGQPRYNDRLKQVHVHHTVNSNAYRRVDVPGLIRGMYRYHTHNLDWSDLGYNFLVDRFGRTWVGRAGGPGRRVRGAHTLGFNHSSTGVAVIGDFERRRPGDEVIRAVARLAAWKLDRDDRDALGRVYVRSEGSDRYREGRRVRLPVIDGHRDTNHTACPGQDLYDRLPGIRRRAQRMLDRH